MNLNDFLQTAPLFRVFIMLAAGVTSGEFLFASSSPGIILITAAAVIITSFLVRRSGTVQSLMLFTALFLVGLASHHVSADMLHLSKRGYYDYKAVVTSNVKHSNGYSTFDIIKNNGDRNEKIKATIKGNVTFNPGDMLHVKSMINPPEDRYRSHFSYAEYLKRNGYSGTTFIKRYNIESERSGYDKLPALTRFRISMLKMRSSLLAHLHEEGLSGRDFATVSAMAFGDKTYLSAGDREMYSRSGVSHVLALSGLHIGIIYAFLTFFMTFVPKVPRFLAIQCAVWFYVVFAGMSPSLVRAALMITVYSAGSLMHRDKISLNSLALAGTVSVLVSPQIIFDLCFQLSFMSVFAIILFYHPIASLLPDHPLAVRKIMQMTAVSAAAYIGTLPLILYNFGSMSYCFLITNLFVIPLTTAVIYLAILSFVPFVGTYITIALAFVIHVMNTFVAKMADLSFLSTDNFYISFSTLILTYIFIFSIYLIYCKLVFTKNDCNG